MLASVAGALAVVGACWLIASMFLQIADLGHTYTVAEVRASLRDRPDQWLGRTVRVRAMLVGCPPADDLVVTTCSPSLWQPALADRAGPGAHITLPVTWAGPDPRLTSLRGLSLVGKLLPGPELDRWGVLATYRVRLRVAVANTLCGKARCYEGVLVDSGG